LNFAAAPADPRAAATPFALFCFRRDRADTAGLAGFYVSNWQAIWAPKGTPKDVVATLNAAVADALASPEVRLRLADLGQEIFPHEQETQEALRAYHMAEIEKWWPIIKAANIKME
jgi:tripartite-type tricarboxylate transporter receptor subunit TctC